MTTNKRPLTDSEIALVADQAREMAALEGRHEQERRALLQTHTDALRNLIGAETFDAEMKAAADDVSPVDQLLAQVVPLALPFIATLLTRPAAPASTIDPLGTFSGPVTPPADAPPGVPVAVPPASFSGGVATPPATFGLSAVIPPPTTTAPPPVKPRGAPLPGTGTHPGCTVERPCAKHGGTGIAIDGPQDYIAPQLAAGHYDGRAFAGAPVDCTIYRPCKECIDRSRRPTATTPPTVGV